MQNDKLLPCPCCGSEIKGGVRLTGFGYVNKQLIECDACGLKMETAYSIGEPILQSQLKAITKELITKWNTRKPMERIVEQLEEESDFFGGEPMGSLQKAYYCKGIKKAIEIVKGGVDNAG